MKSEVLIIGGGVIGLSVARALRKRGVSKITILERGEIGKEASFAAAGMLTPQCDTDEIDDFFNFCFESNQLYPTFVKELFDETGIDVELDQSGTLYLAFNDTDVQKARERFEIQKAAGLEVEQLTAQQIVKAEPFVSPDVIEGLFFEKDWQVENRKLLAALRKFAEESEINLIENTDVKQLLIENGTTFGAATFGQSFTAGHVILATGAWTTLIKSDAISLPKIKPVRGQMMSFSSTKRLFSKVICSPRGYIVPRKSGNILAGATVEDVGFDKSLTDIGIDSVKFNASEISPQLMNLPVEETWSGLRPFASDGLPIIGRFPQCGNLLIATAHFRNGILLAPLTAEILADEIIGESNSKYLEAFSLRRFQNPVKLIAGVEN